MSEALRIFGVDPGIARMGYGIIDVVGNRMSSVDYGCLETPSDWATAERLSYLYDGLQGLLSAHRPKVMAVEQLFFYRNVTTAFVVGQARGVAVLAGVQAGVAYAEYTPMQVKQAVTGYGKADKSQIQEMVRILLNLAQRPQPDDTADALAIAITHAHSAWSNEMSLENPGGTLANGLSSNSSQGYSREQKQPGASERPAVRYGRGVKP